MGCKVYKIIVAHDSPLSVPERNELFRGYNNCLGSIIDDFIMDEKILPEKATVKQLLDWFNNQKDRTDLPMYKNIHHKEFRKVLNGELMCNCSKEIKDVLIKNDFDV